MSSDAFSDSDDNPSENRTSTEAESTDEGDDVIVESATEVFSGIELVRFMCHHHIITAVRLASLWLMASEDLVQDLASEEGETSSILWFRLFRLFNILPTGPSFQHDKFLPHPQVSLVLRQIVKIGDTMEDNKVLKPNESWKEIPMPEDWMAKGMNAFEKHQNGLQWNTLQEENLEMNKDTEEIKLGILRILQLNHFCDWLTTITQTRLGITQKYLESVGSEMYQSRVYLKPKSEAITFAHRVDIRSSHNNLEAVDDRYKVESCIEEKRPALASARQQTLDREKPPKNLEEERSRKTAMMQNMAQLWLQQEVDDLEMDRKVKEREESKDRRSRSRGRPASPMGKFSGTITGFAYYSPYLVMDHCVLISCLDMVKDIVATKKFMTVIPAPTIQQLDDMKKREDGARKAIRWLEEQFQEGNRWLRPQKSHEKIVSDREACQKRKQREDWYYIKIIECCNYFAHVRSFGSEGPSRSNAVAVKVTWITTKESGIVEQMESYKEPIPATEGDDEHNEKSEEIEAQSQLFSFLKTAASNSKC